MQEQKRLAVFQGQFLRRYSQLETTCSFYHHWVIIIIIIIRAASAWLNALRYQQSALSFMHVESSVVLGAPEGGVLQISIDGDDRRIFWRLKPLILEFFWLKFGLIYASITSDGTMKKQTRTDSISNVFIFLFTIV